MFFSKFYDTPNLWGGGGGLEPLQAPFTLLRWRQFAQQLSQLDITGGQHRSATTGGSHIAHIN